MPQLHRLDDAVHDQRRTEPGAEAEKQHPALLVVAQSLHGGIVDQLDATAERRLEVEADPARREVARLRNRPATQHRPGVADRHHIVSPALGEPLDAGHHAARRERRAGVELALLRLPCGENLHVGATDIDREHVHRQLVFFTASLFEAMTASSSFQDFTNDSAPSSCSRAARAPTSTPALANSASTSSQSPPSAGRIEPSSLCKASAFRVASGMVFTVNGAASPLTYRMSDADGSLVPVLAHGRRCGRAPAL